MAKARGVSLFTVAVLADIHGNLAALEAVLRDLATVAPDRVVVAGDLVFNGPRPREVVEAIQSLSATVLRGNTDELVVRASAAGQHVASWTRRQLLAEHLDFLAALPFDCRIEPAPGQTLAICHATPWSISERVPADAPDSLFRRFLRTAGAAVVVYGHIHVAHARFVDGGLVANCGSVGFPLDGTPRASYLVARWEPAVGWSVTHRRVPFDVDAVVSDMTSVGLPGAAERGEELRRAGG